MSNVKEPTITLSELEALYEELDKRVPNSTIIKKYDGTEIITDTAYAWEGVEWVFEEIKIKMGVEIKKEVEE